MGLGHAWRPPAVYVGRLKEKWVFIYVGRPKFGVKLSSLPVLKATLGTGKGGFGSRVDSHWHGVSVWRSLGPWGLDAWRPCASGCIRGPPAVCIRGPPAVYVGRLTLAGLSSA